MKIFFHKIIALSMAFVVFFSTLSFAIDMHFCGDTLVETTLFKKAEGCGMDMQNPATKTCSVTKKNCCNNKQLLIEGQDELQLSVEKLSFEQQVFVASFIYTYNALFESVADKQTSFEIYPPPLIVKNIYKLDETYLI